MKNLSIGFLIMALTFFCIDSTLYATLGTISIVLFAYCINADKRLLNWLKQHNTESYCQYTGHVRKNTKR